MRNVAEDIHNGIVLHFYEDYHHYFGRMHRDRIMMHWGSGGGFLLAHRIGPVPDHNNFLYGTPSINWSRM